MSQSKPPDCRSYPELIADLERAIAQLKASLEILGDICKEMTFHSIGRGSGSLWYRCQHPQIGDVVMEVSSLPNKYTWAERIGWLVRIEKDAHNALIYTVRNLLGQEDRWENAEFYALQTRELRQAVERQQAILTGERQGEKLP